MSHRQDIQSQVIGVGGPTSSQPMEDELPKIVSSILKENFEEFSEAVMRAPPMYYSSGVLGNAGYVLTLIS